MWFISKRNTQHVHDTQETRKKKTLQKWSTHIFLFILILMMFRRPNETLLYINKNAKTKKKGNLVKTTTTTKE